MKAKTAWLLATWFGAGDLPGAPGTWGSLAALPFAWALIALGGVPTLVAAAAVVFLIGWWASDAMIVASGITDPGRVVIDEVTAQWLAVAMIGSQWWQLLIAFLLFRLFDIWKPWPVSWADRYLHGGLGVMADDIIAALYAGITFWIGMKVFRFVSL